MSHCSLCPLMIAMATCNDVCIIFVMTLPRQLATALATALKVLAGHAYHDIHSKCMIFSSCKTLNSECEQHWRYIHAVLQNARRECLGILYVSWRQLYCVHRSRIPQGALLHNEDASLMEALRNCHTSFRDSWQYLAEQYPLFSSRQLF